MTQIILHIARSSHWPPPCFTPLSILNVGRKIIIDSLRKLLFILSFPGTYLPFLNEDKQNEYIGGDISRRPVSFIPPIERVDLAEFFLPEQTHPLGNGKHK